jgi:mannitol-1-phosphate 5-dehydrogenase
VPEDAESVELQKLLSSGRPANELAEEITGLAPDHPLFPSVVEVFERRLDG